MNNLRLLSPALASWVRALPSTGLFEALGDGRFRLRVSQSQLADALGYTSGAGALSRRLQRLEAVGVVVSRRPLVIALPEEEPIARSSGATSVVVTSHVPAPVLAPVSRSEDALLRDLLQRCVDDRLEILGSRVLDLLFPDRCAASSPAGPPSSREQDSPRAARVSARVSPMPSGDLRNSVQTDIYLSGAERAQSARRTYRAGRSIGDLQRLLHQLLVECSARGLPGVSNLPGLLAALDHLDDDEVTKGAAFVVNQIRSGVEVRSPFGLLAALAARGSLSDTQR